MVADFRDRMSKFVSGVFEDAVKECRTAMLVKHIDISRIKKRKSMSRKGRVRGLEHKTLISLSKGR